VGGTIQADLEAEIVEMARIKVCRSRFVRGARAAAD